MSAEPLFTLTAGPVQPSAETIRALATPVYDQFDPYFLEVYESTVENLRIAMGVSTAPVILHGEAVLGLEAAAASLIARDDVVLNLASGVYGKGYGYWAARYCKELLEIEVPYNQVINPNDVEQMFRKRPDIAIVAVVHSETPSGTLNPVREIAAVCARYGALLIVDAVSSFGATEVDFEGWPADLVVVGPQKALGGPPGLSLLYVSDRAWKKIEDNPDAPVASMLSISDWRNAHLASVKFPFTPSITEIYALNSTVAQYLREGPKAAWARHTRVANAVQAGLLGMGLELWPDNREHCSPALTAFKLPAGCTGAAVRAHAREHYGVMISGGYGELTDSLLRIGHMGPTAYPVFAAVGISAVGQSMRDLGVNVDVGAGVSAAMSAVSTFTK
ncbi:MAG: alanine--glyoxylate aminotransferase family protein [Ilumatobacteraceae bacterium]|jgi:pyridoxamine--pyruvate transaminase|nr:alanine--glyoxylate aminotransferase family protein [Ilumatobacteraceae bacterium]